MITSEILNKLCGKTAGWLYIALTMILTSCSSENHEIASPLDAVPDSARFIALFDLATLGDNADKFLPAEVVAPVDEILQVGEEGVDISSVAIFTTGKGYTVAVMKVNDRELLEDALRQKSEEEKGFDDFAVFTLNGRKIILDDARCFISPDTQSVKKILKEKRPQISAIQGVREFLANSDEAITTASIASDIYGKKLEGLWLCRALHFTESSVSLDFSLLKPGGESGQIGALLADPIDPTALAFIPDGCSLVAASGLQQEGAKMFGIESLLRSYIPFELNMSTTGTTAWYGRPAGALNPDDLFNPRTWNFASFSQSSQAEGAELINSLRSQLGNRAVRNSETDCYSASYSGLEVSFGYLQGYSAMMINGEISFGNSNSYTTDFQAARMVILVDIPKDSRLQQAAGLPCGASLNVKVTTDNLHAKLRFYGSSAPALATVDEIDALRNILPFLMGLR